MAQDTEQSDILTQEELEQAYADTIKTFDDGDVVTGTVLKIDKDEVLVDIGYKSEGVIPVRELSIRHDVDPFEEVELGQEIDALVLQKEDKEGRLILSKKRAQYEKAWSVIEEVKNSGQSITGRVIEQVKGGLILDVGLRGFLPASLVDIRRVGELGPFVGQELECKIIELDRNRNNVVLSRRAFLEETQAETRKDLLLTLKKGEQRSGRVSSIVKFGAFVDLGGIDGLVHVSELSWKHIEDPAEVVHVGQDVEVEVLDVDIERERISLSLKSTQEDPWRAFARRHAPGDILSGRVTKLVSFGAFVQLGDGLEGLVHISELSGRHVETPAEVVAVGDEVEVKILDVDPKRRRVSLSIKQAMEGPGVPVRLPVTDETAEAPISQDAYLEPEAELDEGGEEEARPDESSDTLEAIVRDMRQKS
jgi:small subunit ribosomal protein S1